MKKSLTIRLILFYINLLLKYSPKKLIKYVDPLMDMSPRDEIGRVCSSTIPKQELIFYWEMDDVAPVPMIYGRVTVISPIQPELILRKEYSWVSILTGNKVLIPTVKPNYPVNCRWVKLNLPKWVKTRLKRFYSK